MVSLVAVGCSDAARSNWAEGESGRVVRIQDGDTLALETGQSVRLVSIEAPAPGYRGREDAPFSEEAKRIMEALALGRQARLYYPGLTRDRYDRALAQVFVTTETGKEIWLNEALVLEGAAWVRLYADTARGSDELWTAESKARSEPAGLWAGSSPETDLAAAGQSDGLFVILTVELDGAEPVGNECEHSVRSSDIVVRYRISGLACSDRTDAPVEIRGWARGGSVDIGTALNIRPISQ